VTNVAVHKQSKYYIFVTYNVVFFVNDLSCEMNDRTF